jgi:hypothetical protein
LPCPIRKQPNRGEGPRCTKSLGLLHHIHPWLQFQIGARKNVLQKHRKIKSIKNDFTATKIVLVRQMISLDFE